MHKRYGRHIEAVLVNTITTKDGTQIYYKDRGSEQSIVFSHGWPLSADAWEDAMFFFASRVYRCIAADGRGHGRSSLSWNGNDMDTYADDLATLVDKLDVKDAVYIGHSTGGGEVVKTASNPAGTPIEVYDGIRAGVAGDRPQYFADLNAPLASRRRPHRS